MFRHCRYRVNNVYRIEIRPRYGTLDSGWPITAGLTVIVDVTLTKDNIIENSTLYTESTTDRYYRHIHKTNSTTQTNNTDECKRLTLTSQLSQYREPPRRSLYRRLRAVPTIRQISARPYLHLKGPSDFVHPVVQSPTDLVHMSECPADVGHSALHPLHRDFGPPHPSLLVDTLHSPRPARIRLHWLLGRGRATDLVSDRQVNPPLQRSRLRAGAPVFQRGLALPNSAKSSLSLTGHGLRRSVDRNLSFWLPTIGHPLGPGSGLIPRPNRA